MGYGGPVTTTKRKKQERSMDFTNYSSEDFFGSTKPYSMPTTVAAQSKA
jgi:hypothetical protein